MHQPTKDELVDVLDLQRTDFLQEGTVAFKTRFDRLERAIDLLKSNESRLIDAMSTDFGHRSMHQSLFTDIAGSIGPLRIAQKQLKDWMRPEKRKAGPFPLNLLGAKARVEFQPLGVVGLISPWNFPVNLTFSPLAGIVSAGNRCMIKPSEYTPATSEAMAEIFPTAFDQTEIAVITGGPETGANFSSLPFDHLLFTGATSIAYHVMRAAAENLVPVTLELGGKSPVVIGRSADLQKTTDSIMTGKLLNAGQICLAPDYVFLPEESVEEFVEASERSVSRMYPTLLDNPDYTSVINEQHFDRLTGYVNEARERGTRIVKINPANEDFSQQPHHKMPPTLVIDPPDDLKVMEDEIFGPVLPIKSYRNVGDTIQEINDRPRPLGLYYYGRDSQEEERVLSSTTSGGVTVNDVVMHVAQEDLPFGGIGASGTGSYHGIDGFKRFSHAKAIFTQSRLNVAELAGLRPPYGKKLLGSARQQMR